jgi:hypothetical protein
MQTTNTKRCPRCGSADVLPIIYGYPSEKMIEDSAAGRISLGGCTIWQGESPAFECDSCGHRWGIFTDDRE